MKYLFTAKLGHPETIVFEADSYEEASCYFEQYELQHPNHITCKVFEVECKKEEKHDDVLAEESIKVLNAMLSTHQWEPVRRELEFAINELKKCIPTKPVRASWAPNRCPNCDANLGGRCNDGYFQNPHYELCPECRQVLDYE